MHEDLIKILTERNPSQSLRERLEKIIREQLIIREVSLASTKMDWYDLSVLQQFIQARKTTISSFSLKGHENLTDEEIASFIDCLSEVPELSALYFDFTSIGAKGLDALKKLIARNQKLETIHLFIDNLISSPHLNSLVTAIRANPAIKNITINGKEYNHEGLRLLTGLLAEDKFTAFQVGCSEFKEEDCRNIGEAITGLQKITDFSLVADKYGDLGFIVHKLNENPHIPLFLAMNRRFEPFDESLQKRVEAICHRNKQAKELLESAKKFHDQFPQEPAGVSSYIESGLMSIFRERGASPSAATGGLFGSSSWTRR